MKKKAYISTPPMKSKMPLSRGMTLSAPGSYDSVSEDGMPEGSRGLSMPLESTQIPLYRSDEFEVRNDYDNNHEIRNFDDLSKILLELSDSLDKKREYTMADFSDFLIIKISEIKNKDYEKLFRMAIINLANSDVINPSDIIRSAVVRYSNMVLEGNSEESAYNDAVKILFLNDKVINKSAQILEMNPTYVADQLHKIIKIMLAKISPEKRSRSFKNVAEKLSDFNVLEISNKKAPGGAAIGASLGLVKNVLNSKDSYFVNVVLKELIKRL